MPLRAATPGSAACTKTKEARQKQPAMPTAKRADTSRPEAAPTCNVLLDRPLRAKALLGDHASTSIRSSGCKARIRLPLPPLPPLRTGG